MLKKIKLHLQKKFQHYFFISVFTASEHIASPNEAVTPIKLPLAFTLASSDEKNHPILFLKTSFF